MQKKNEMMNDLQEKNNVLEKQSHYQFTNWKVPIQKPDGQENDGQNKNWNDKKTPAPPGNNGNQKKIEAVKEGSNWSQKGEANIRDGSTWAGTAATYR